MCLRCVFILIFIGLASCTTHQEVNKKIEVSKEVLKERAAGAKKITEARSEIDVHRVLEIQIPHPSKPKKEEVPAPAKEVEVDVFDVRPSGMVR